MLRVGPTLSPDGTLLDLPNYNLGPDELGEVELDRWVDGFPIELCGKGAA